jgi:hypothetical protein
MSLASLQEQIFRLDAQERARLIDLLWDSLDEARIKEIEAKWPSESEDRIEAFDRGELSAVDAPTLSTNCVRLLGNERLSVYFIRACRVKTGDAVLRAEGERARKKRSGFNNHAVYKKASSAACGNWIGTKNFSGYR